MGIAIGQVAIGPSVSTNAEARPAIGDHSIGISSAPAINRLPSTPEPIARHWGLRAPLCKYTFERFIAGRTNWTARSVAAEFATPFNNQLPLLCLFGACGVGKTHLMEAAGNKVLGRNPQAKVKYIHSLEYGHQFCIARRYGHLDSFRRTYDALDVLLLDDIQCLSGSDDLQVELARHIERLSYPIGARIVMTCDGKPRDLAATVRPGPIECEFHALMNCGVLVEIHPADHPLKINVLRERAREVGILLDEDCLNCVSDKLRGSHNMRELEGALNRLGAWARFYNEKISVDLANRSLSVLGT